MYFEKRTQISQFNMELVPQMKGRLTLIKLLSVLVLFMLPLSSSAKEIIQWVWYEQVPYFVGPDPSQGIGVGDKLTRLFQESLPEYEHQNIKVNALRYSQLIKEDNVCVPVAWSSPDERKYLVSSRPHTLEPPAGIYIHQSKQADFGPPETVLSLAALLKNSELKLGALSGMEYSVDVDKLLADYHGKKNLILIDATKVQINLQMLKLNRIDYFLGLPAQKAELALNNQEDEYLFYNLREISKYIPMYAHCSNNELGKQIITKLNVLLTDVRLGTFIKAYESWYGENMLFRRLFNRHVILRQSDDHISDI